METIVDFFFTNIRKYFSKFTGYVYFFSFVNKTKKPHRQQQLSETVLLGSDSSDCCLIGKKTGSPYLIGIEQAPKG